MRKTKVTEQVEALARQVRETRNAVIRAENQVRLVEAQVKRIGQEESGRAKRVIRAIILAYLVATAISAVGLWTAFEARSGAVTNEVELLRGALATEQATYRRLEAELAARRDAERRAAEIWRLISTMKRVEAIEAFATADLSGFTETERAVLRTEIERFRSELSRKSFDKARIHYEAKELAPAEAAFKASLEMSSDAPHSSQAWYYLALAHYQLGRFRECADELHRAIAGGIDPSVEDDAHYYLGSAFESLKEYPRARDEYRFVVESYKASPWAAMARTKLFKLKDK